MFRHVLLFRLCVIPLAFILPTLSFAQQFNQSQLEKIAAFNKTLEDPTAHDTAIAGAYIGLSELFAYKGDVQSSGNLGEKALKAAEKAIPKYDDEDILNVLSGYRATALNNIGAKYQGEGDLRKALDYQQKAFLLRKQVGDKSKIAESLNNLAVTHQSLGDSEKTLQFFMESLNILMEIGKNPDHIGIIKSNIADAYSAQENYQDALKYALEGSDYLSRGTWKTAHTHALNSVSYNYKNLGDYEKSIEYAEKSLHLAEEIDYKEGIGLALISRGIGYTKQGNFDLALEDLNRSLEIRNQLKNPVMISQTLRYLGEVYFRQAKVAGISSAEKKILLTKALEASQKSLDMALEIGHAARIKFGTEIIHEIYAESGDFKKAYELQSLFTQIRDSISNSESQESYTKATILAEFQLEKSQIDAEHEKELAVAAEREAKQKVYTYSIAGGLGLSALFLLFAVNRIRVTNRQKKAITQQKAIIEESHREITDSIHYAKRIQAAVLPPDSVFRTLLPNAFVLYKPKDIVAGDFYWLEQKDDLILFAAADCTGHGVPGAMVSVICNNGLNRSVREMGLTEPGKILDNTRDIVVREFEKSEDEVKDGMDIALCSLKGKTLKYAGANNPLWLIRNGELIEYKADKQPIGKHDNPLPYTTHTIELQTGDSIYLFSDGYVDQFGGERGKKYKSLKFKAKLTEICQQPIMDQSTLLDREFESWKGDLEQIDDVCVIGMKV
ncbi:MAG: tetratricopeptide repeat protein [Flavobacteriales bacterium]|nr:tetratricopeptide repeat protein [Flavobacteriales bacterium]